MTILKFIRKYRLITYLRLHFIQNRADVLLILSILSIFDIFEVSRKTR